MQTKQLLKAGCRTFTYFCGMKISFAGKPLVALLLMLLGFGCSSNYQLSKSNRQEYPVSSAIALDSAVLKTYLPYKSALDSQMNTVIGHSAIAMSKKSGDTLPESLLSNFFADATLRQARKIDAKIDFAMPSTKGGIRVDLPKGPLTVSHIYELMPFENELIVCTIKGSEAQQLLDFIAASKGQPVAGLSMKIKDKKAVDVVINGAPFDINRNYRVLTSDYVASGGDNTIGFKDPVEKKVLGLKVRDALLKEVADKQAEGKTITAQLDGRITY